MTPAEQQIAIDLLKDYYSLGTLFPSLETSLTKKTGEFLEKWAEKEKYPKFFTHIQKFVDNSAYIRIDSPEKPGVIISKNKKEYQASQTLREKEDIQHFVKKGIWKGSARRLATQKQ